ncbi:MAG: efflux RND transporter permease subunit [Myxococcales bacterium]|nr:efflux RND transporter permease subunit [Myxococcales bacterium]
MYRLTIERPVAITMVVLGVVVFGLIAYRELPLNLMPQMSYPRLTIRTEYPGSSPEEVELELSRPIEEILGTVSHLVRLTSRSRAGMSEVVIEFDWKASMDLAMQEVREKLDLLRLPTEAKRPILLRYDPNLDPMMRLGLSGQTDLFRLRMFAEDEIRPSLETLPGVAAVKIRGGLEREVEVALNEKKISALGLTIQRVIQRLREENINIAGGRLQEGATNYWVRTLNEFQNLEDMGRLLIEEREGRPVRLHDIARLRFHAKEQEVITRMDGHIGVELSIFREAGANIVEVSKRVQTRIFGTLEQRAYAQRLAEGGQKRRPSPKAGSKKGKKAKKGGKKRWGKGRRGRGGGGRWAKMRAQREERRRHKQLTNFLMYTLPGEMNLRVLQDQAIFIRDAVNEVLQSAVMGGIIAVFVLMLFLRHLWSTIIIGLSIPLSVVATFGGLYLSGVSLNIMSLGGLALGIGMLVDNSIVVLESIMRFREDGVEIDDAAVQGVSEVGGAVTASTLTTVAVFFPIVFVRGMAGELLRDMALTVVISLMSSLIVSLFFIPMLSALQWPSSDAEGEEGAASSRFQAWQRLKEAFAWLGRRWREGGILGRGIWLIFVLPMVAYLLVSFVAQSALELLGAIWRLIAAIGVLALRVGWQFVASVAWVLWMPIAWVMDRFLDFLAWSYPKFLGISLRQSGAVLLLSVLLGAGAYALLPLLDQEFMPKVHQGEFALELALPVGTPLLQTADRIKDLESMVAEIPGVASLSSAIGVEKTEIQNAEKGEHSATLNVKLQKTAEIETQEKNVVEAIRQRLAQEPGLKMKVVYPSLFSLRTPIEVEIKGERLPLLRQVSQQALQSLQSLQSLRDVRSSSISGLPEIQILYDREKLFRYGLSVQQVAQAVRDKVYGAVATRFRQREKRLDVLVRVRRKQLDNVNALLNLTIHSADDKPIPLRQVATVKVDEGPSEILRVSNQRAVLIWADLSTATLGQASRSIEEQLGKIKMPIGFTAGMSGQSEEMQRSINALLYALLLSIFLVYLVMASQFESFISPLIILFSIPLAFIGVVFCLIWLDMPISVMVLIGLIILAGIVVNNAIVLVDAIGKLQQRGVAGIEAIQRACALRLRPILMTTLTTVLGLFPLALGLGEGSELRRPMAITIMAGLLFSTILTLVVIPVIYRLVFLRKEVMPAEAPPTDELSAQAENEIP